MEELKQMMTLMLEKVDRINDGLEEVKQRLDAVERRLDAVEQRLDTLEKRVDRLEVETTKNSVMLEDLKRKLELMAEIQQSHFEQDKREHEELRKYVDGRFVVLEFAARQISSSMDEMKKDIKELKENRVKVEVFYEILGRHEVEISNLKKAVFSAN
ncbi:hypothetical protein Calow_0183 [Caldicellulosiruptor owensensis OL]|uniref:Uncharacterized protein n=1 Tax=Caldicellulosiruptor owensensis (strain ATCC 700167 / DSM 13100 / OL) TaxID=632518 RepID=E4Q2N6_CALOW|nr:hypothetical protein [Caldicellulosiruptor owensensis]ADQ03790.1 hypothetical protein Calow_0183 [Caldicellulosiruptor owensensis OL]